MSRVRILLTALIIMLVASTDLFAGGKAHRRDGRTAGSKRRVGKSARRPANGRVAVLPPVTLGRAAGLSPVTIDRAAGLPPITIGRAAGLNSISLGRAATLAPITVDRAAGLMPVNVDRAANLPAISLGRAATLSPITVDRAAGLMPVNVDRVANLTPISLGRAAQLSPVTIDRAAGLAPVNVDRVANLPPISLGRAAQLQGVTTGRVAGLSSVVTLATDPWVIAYEDGFVAPYEARALVREGFFQDVFAGSVERPFINPEVTTHVTETFAEAGLGGIYPLAGSVYEALDAIDPYGPHRAFKAPLGYNVPPGDVVGGSFYFPAAYYIRPLNNRSRQIILVPRDVAEYIPEDFDRVLRKSHFPLVIGDMAFKDGKYVQAALAFRDAMDRKEDSVAPRFALADALVALRNYSFAADLIRSGLEGAPKWADDLDRHGVYAQKGDLERHIDQLAAFAEDHQYTQNLWFLLGYLHMTSGDEKQRPAAIAAFRAALDVDPDDAVSLRYFNRLKKPSGE